jgi:glyoxylase-like metal-dependent hydrolase (beta-lactamase superfamily II)
VRPEIQSFLTTAQAVEMLLHPFAEIVLHDLKTNRVVAIFNSFSHRQIGDDSLLNEIEFDTSKNIIGPYEKLNWDGRRLKSISIVIRDLSQVPVGFLCINLDASKFDHLFEDGEVFKLGNMDVKVLHTPGHTPACSSYLIEDAIFVGDTIFMPDIGTARTDFPGGSASSLYDSVKKILSLPDETRIFMCHDYPPQGRDVAWLATVKEQKEKNVLLHDGISKEEYVAVRNKRDEGKAVPKLLLPSIQANLRAGTFGEPEDNNVRYIKIPVDKI